MAQRKRPVDRRDEIRGAAASVALEEGLGRVTARRIADRIGVRSGLVTHYFDSIDELVAEAFEQVVSSERARINAATSSSVSSVTRIHQTLSAYIAPSRDPFSLLWLDAWRQSADRPILRRAVVQQMELDVAVMESLILDGVKAGEFPVASPSRAAMRILSVLDGQMVSSAVRSALSGSSLDYPAVEDMVFAVAELELGLSAGSLRHTNTI